MSLALGQIGYFQLSNLVRNKVPFSLFVIGFEPPTGLTGDLNLLMKAAVLVQSQNYQVKIEEMKLRVDHPIVLMCESGPESANISVQLSERGFLNVYCVKGGWVGLTAEAGYSS